MRWLRAFGVVVVVLGVMAAAVMVTPAVYGQIVGSNRDGDRRLRFDVFGGQGGRIGVSVRDVESSDTAREKLSSPNGVVIEEVRRDSPAEKAGLRAGDIVVEFDGMRVRSAAEFTRVVRETPRGHAVKMAYVRDGKRSEANITVEDRGAVFFDTDVIGPDLERRLEEIGPRIERRLERIGPEIERELGRLGPEIERKLERLGPEIERKLNDLRLDGNFNFAFPAVSRARLGVTVQELTPQLATYFGATDGVLIASVAENSPASKAGLKAGDVVTAINGSTVTSQSELVRLLDRADNDMVTLSIVRDRKTISAKATLERDRPARVRRQVLRRGAAL